MLTARLLLSATLAALSFVIVTAAGAKDDANDARLGPIIGIDLGTTYSCVAIAKEDGMIEIIPNDQGNRITPSYIAFGNRRERFIGDAAKNQATLNPTRTIFDVKRLIGRGFHDESVQADRRLLPYIISETEDEDGGLVIQIPIGENGEMQSFAPEELSAMLLSYLRSTAEKYLGGNGKKGDNDGESTSVNRAVITVPAYFNDAQRAATKNAGTIAGFHVERILNEPTAAAIAYGISEKAKKDADEEEETTILVYDLGGGTLDVTILTLDQGVFEVLATHGDTHLGGQDFDQRIMDYYIKKLLPSGEEDEFSSIPPRALQQLRAESERVKRTLSTQFQARLEMDDWPVGNGRTVDVSELLTRAKFEALNDDLFRKTLEPVKLALKDAMLDAEDIDSVVLVGGSTRIPRVQSLLREFFGDGVPLHTQLNPDEAVAYGAAVQASILSGGSNNTNEATKDLLLLDVTPLSLGTMTDDGLMTVLIKRGTTIPTERTMDFITLEDNQSEMSIDVYEGERSMAEDNHLLGKFDMSNLRPAPRGEVTIWITFAIDANGILQVTAEDRVTKQKDSLIITPDGSSSGDGSVSGRRLSQRDIDRMIQDAERYASQDKAEKERIEARNSLEHLVYDLSNLIRNDERVKGLNDEDQKELSDTLAEETEWLESNQGADTDAFEDRRGQLSAVVAATRSSLNSIGKVDENDEL